jgi:predicted PurR-regulated permease PerM
MEYKTLKGISAVLLSVFIVVIGLIFGSSFFIPFTVAFFLATLIRPVNQFFEGIGVNKIIATLISVMFVFFVISVLILVLINQLQKFLIDFDEVEKRMQEFFVLLQDYFESLTGIPPADQNDFLRGRSEDIFDMIERNIRIFIGDLFTIVFHFFLIIIFLFLFLLNRDKYVQFVLMYVKKEKEEEVRGVIEKTSRVAHHYLWGRIKVMFLLSLMYIITFMIFDLRHAVLITILGALLTIIPYVGPWMSGFLPIISALLMGEPFYHVVWLGVVIFIIQMIESYVLEPVFIGSEVKLSPLMIIVAIIIGGMIWGIPGMILFVPMLAVFKILADHAPGLRPVGYLLGYGGKKPGEEMIARLTRMFKK